MPVRSRFRFVLLAISFIVVIGLALAIALHGGSADHSGTSNGAHGGNFDGAAFPAGVRARDFTLRDQSGQSVSLGDYRGKVVVLAFLSSRCRTCVLVADQVRGALDELEAVHGVSTIFVSTDPRADTSQSVNRFLSEVSLGGRVEYLTGAQRQLEPVWKAYAIAPVSAGRSASEAGTTVLLIDRAGLERVGFGLEQITPEGLTHDIRQLEGG